MTKLKVLIASDVDKKADRAFEAAGYCIERFSNEMPPKELAAKIGPFDVLIVRGAPTQVTEEVINNAKKLKVIGRAGKGTENINEEAATARGIVIMTTPGANAVSVAEECIFLMIGMGRGFFKALAQMLKGRWNRRIQGNELYGQTVGIFGLGYVGEQVALRCAALGMKVLAYDIKPAYPVLDKTAKSDDLYRALALALPSDNLPEIPLRSILERYLVRRCSPEEIMRKSDFISVNLALTPETEGFINQDLLRLAKRSAYVINTGRGEIVDELAVLEALENKRLKGYATDVISGGKFNPKNEIHRKLKERQGKDVVLLPHLGSNTRRSKRLCAEMISKQVIEFVEVGSITNSVNFVEFVPGRKEGARFLLIVGHRNVPGVVGDLGTICGDAGINWEKGHFDAKQDGGNGAACAWTFTVDKIKESVLRELRQASNVYWVREIELSNSPS